MGDNIAHFLYKKHLLYVTSYSFTWPRYMIIFKIKIKTMTTCVPKLVSQGLDRYNNIMLIDTITLLAISYRED